MSAPQRTVHDTRVEQLLRALARVLTDIARNPQTQKASSEHEAPPPDTTRPRIRS